LPLINEGETERSEHLRLDIYNSRSGVVYNLLGMEVEAAYIYWFRVSILLTYIEYVPGLTLLRYNVALYFYV
jgi:hypothetical protein